MDGATFHLVYDYLKITLLQQLAERRRALRHASDERVRYGARLLDPIVERVATKYAVTGRPVELLQGLEGALREANQSPTTNLQGRCH